ncbi:hypothetical protein [Clostridium sp. DL1XJH146]
MTYKKEFELQWKNFNSVVESEIIKQIKENGKVTISQLNRVIDIQKNKWLSSNEYQGIWLLKLKAQNAEIGRKFEKVIDEMEFSEVESTKSSSFMPYVAISIASGFLFFFLGKIISLATWQLYGAAIIAPIIFGTTFYGFWKSQNVNNRLKDREIYLKELDMWKEQLLVLCYSLDKNN